MKRKDNLYQEICKMKHIEFAFNEICRNTENKRKVYRFKEYKCINLSKIQKALENREYVVGRYIRFKIYEPKERSIVSQEMPDKLVNHLVSRYILMPALMPCLIDTNVACRVKMGTKKGLQYYREFHRKCRVRYDNYYVLKCDISKYFASIDQEILKAKLRKKIKDRDALKIVFDIIESEPQGLGIGNMTSQILAVFYLDAMDHYIKEELKIKYYLRYQDDFILFHPSKEYLKECLEKIKVFLEKEKLTLNRKTRIFNGRNNFVYLGRSKNSRYAKYRLVNRRIKAKKHLYEVGKIDLQSYCSTLLSYKFLKNEFRKKMRSE